MNKYFKKFSIMFLMILAVMGIGMIQNGSVANAATVGQQLTSPEDGWQRIENTDSNINYSSGWDLNYRSGDSGGNDSYIDEGKDSYVKFNFISNKIRIIIAYNPIHNNCAELYIDKVKVKTLELNFSNLRQVVVYENTNLTDSEHSFEMKFVGTGQGVFDAVDIDKNGKLKPYNENIESLTLDKSIMNLTQGDSGKITATTTPADTQVTWTTSDPSIATVDSNGKVTGIKEGTCTITATTSNGLTATCIVTVTKQNSATNTGENTSTTTNPNGNNGTTTGNSCGCKTNSYGILNINTPSGFTQNNNNGGNGNSSNNSGNNNNSGNSGNNYSNNNNSNSNNNYYYYNNYYLSFNTKA